MTNQDQLAADIAAGRELNSQLWNVIHSMVDEPYLVVLRGLLIVLAGLHQQSLGTADQTAQQNGCEQLVIESAQTLGLDTSWDDEEAYLRLRDTVVQRLSEETSRMLDNLRIVMLTLGLSSELVPPLPDVSLPYECDDMTLKAAVNNYMTAVATTTWLFEEWPAWTRDAMMINPIVRGQIITELHRRMSEEAFDALDLANMSVFELREILERERRYDEIIETACRVNIPEFTNMSCESLAALMLAQFRREPENWSPGDQIVRGRNVASLVMDWYADISTAAGWVYDLVGIWIEHRNDVERLRGASLGIPNLYPHAVLEAYRFLVELDAIAPNYHRDLIEMDFNLYELGGQFLRQLDDDLAFMFQSAAATLVWAGARQRINVGAGTADYPALNAVTINNIAAGNFNIPQEEISAFSLSTVRYSDAVSASYWDGEYWWRGEFVKTIQAVEGITDAATTLEVTDEVRAFDTFLPYTEREAQCIIAGLRRRNASPDYISRFPLLLEAYERAAGPRPSSPPSDDAWNQWFDQAVCE